MARNFSSVFRAHRGKVSDKWSSYLPAYDALLDPLMAAPISLLEIGVQNGGSLEIYAEFFKNARHIVGCDIHPACRRLSYADPRIRLVVDDCTRPGTKQAIRAISPAFDLIIDDGSHVSRDIVRSFLMYFELLGPGGVYIAEDLHASYWRNWEGGLLYPRSSIAFFKLLVDVANAEHWGIQAGARELLLHHFANERELILGAGLSGIQSVEFRNSLCIVRKASAPEQTGLGHRVITGTVAAVIPGIPAHQGAASLCPDERQNPFSRLKSA